MKSGPKKRIEISLAPGRSSGGGVKWAAVATVCAALGAGGYAYVKYNKARQDEATRPAGLKITERVTRDSVKATEPRADPRVEQQPRDDSNDSAGHGGSSAGGGEQTEPANQGAPGSGGQQGGADRRAGDTVKPDATTAEHAAGAAEHECDRLAADWPDPKAVTRFVDLHQMRPFAAIRACEDAVEKHPDVLRFQHQLAYAMSADRRHRKAFERFRQLADKGYRPSIRRLGIALYNGEGASRDEASGFEWLKKAANAGDGLAARLLGKQYAKGGDSFVADAAASKLWLEKALALFRRDAEAGFFHAAYMTGEAYEFGQGTVKDFTAARDWYRRGAESDKDPAAMERLGLVYQHGDGGTPRDAKEALRWYRMAAEAGSGMGMNQVGFFHFQGLGGLKKDAAAAASWYTKAAGAGNAVAMTNLAWCYEHGSGVETNFEDAGYWYLEAHLRGEKLKDLKIETVVAIQLKLVGEGYFEGEADGIMNGETLEALQKFYDANKG